MFWGPVDSSSSSSRVATEGRKGLRGHSGDFMATPASSIDLKQSFRVSEKTLSTLSLSCLFVCLFVYFISLGVFHGFLNRPQPSVPRIREISEILSALSFSGISWIDWQSKQTSLMWNVKLNSIDAPLLLNLVQGLVVFQNFGHIFVFVVRLQLWKKRPLRIYPYIHIGWIHVWTLKILKYFWYFCVIGVLS